MFDKSTRSRQVCQLLLSLIVGKPLYREKTVYIKTHKTAINRPVDYTGETQQTF